MRDEHEVTEQAIAPGAGAWVLAACGVRHVRAERALVALSLSETDRRGVADPWD